MVNPLPDTIYSYFQDKPHMAVDDRASGTGAGNVYVSATEFDSYEYYSRIWLVSCKSSLSACSSPIIVSGSDTQTQFSHIAVRPDGVVSVTYINVAYNPNTGGNAFDIKYVRCSAANAPITPSCYPPVLVRHETQPLDFGNYLGAEDFRVVTYPKHDYQTETDQTVQAIVVWDRCKVATWPYPWGWACPDADVLMSASKDSGATWSAATAVDTNLQDQFFPWIKTDRYRNIANIVYYTSAADTPWQHRLRVALRQINPGAVVPNPVGSAITLTTTLDDPASDPVLGGLFFGDYIGVAARGTSSTAATSTAYVGFTWNAREGTYNGQAVPQQDDNIGRVDY